VQGWIDEVLAECGMSEVARKAAASRIVRAIGIEVMHKQNYMIATLIQELKNEGSLWRISRTASYEASLADRQRFPIIWFLAYSYKCS
jgi:hypothetical protein